MIRIAHSVYLVASWSFLAGVVAQVYLIGLVVLAGRIGLDPHRSLGHALALPLLLMLVAVHLGRSPRGVRGLTWALFGVYLVQADVLPFLRGSLPEIAALHPVLALADIVLGLTLARRALAPLPGQREAERAPAAAPP